MESVAFFLIYAVCGVRRPIRFRPPSDQIPFAVRSDSVRRPIGFRSPSDQIPFAARNISYYYTL